MIVFTRVPRFLLKKYVVIIHHLTRRYSFLLEESIYNINSTFSTVTDNTVAGSPIEVLLPEYIEFLIKNDYKCPN